MPKARGAAKSNLPSASSRLLQEVTGRRAVEIVTHVVLPRDQTTYTGRAGNRGR